MIWEHLDDPCCGCCSNCQLQFAAKYRQMVVPIKVTFVGVDGVMKQKYVKVKTFWRECFQVGMYSSAKTWV